jgi:glucose-6-phosphate 1-dehydrogenase
MSAEAASAVVRPADPCSFVIFGASGDLTRRLLIPALYNLAAGGLLPDAFCVIGVARKDFSNEAFRTRLEKGLREFATREVDARVAERLFACVTYLRGPQNIRTAPP